MHSICVCPGGVHHILLGPVVATQLLECVPHPEETPHFLLIWEVSRAAKSLKQVPRNSNVIVPQ
jgi:hypothetical protein